MSSTSSKATVDNPLYAQLKALYAQLQKDADTMSGALRSADHLMLSGQVWVGPTARKWADHINHRSRDCATQVRNMLSEVEAAIARTPAKVTPQEAQSIAKLTAMAAQMGG
ncbi:MAG TPA: hypothetical protein VHF26_08075 [Trebonia sp.]|nr:hypothetical protein [Trebonia sp.]